MKKKMVGRRTREQHDICYKENLKHYIHACSKHRVFINENPVIDVREAESTLLLSRENLRYANRYKKRNFFHVLDCEVSEMVYEIAAGNKERAVEEARDCIAVLERVIDWIEGREIPSDGKDSKQQ